MIKRTKRDQRRNATGLSPEAIAELNGRPTELAVAPHDPDSESAWMADGNCRLHPPATFFPSDGVGVDKARKICRDCPVMGRCLEYALEERIERMGLQDKFGEILVPTEEVVEMREGQKRRSERKFFPGYVLVQMEMDDETWHLVKEVPKVLGFIGGSSDRPAPNTEKEADRILQRVQEGVDKPRPKVLFEPGEVVRVTDGPFNDFSGVVEQVNYEKNRLQVAVQILGRATPVELDFGQVEKS